MLTCIYKDNQITSLDTKNEYGVGNFEVIKDWCIAASKNELICEECKQPVFLRNGEIRVPHFAHKPGSKIVCHQINESEEHRKAKRLLRNYFLKKHEGIKINLNYKHDNKIRSDLFIEFVSGEKLAIEFQLQNININKFISKQKKYLDTGVKSLWFLSNSSIFGDIDRKNSVLTLCNETNEKTAIFLNVENEEIQIVKLMEYREKNNDKIKKMNLFYKKYNLDDVLIKENGLIECTFNTEYEKALELFLKENKEREEKEELERFNKVKLEEEQKKNEELESLNKTKLQDEIFEKRNLGTQKAVIYTQYNKDIFVCELCKQKKCEDEFWFFIRSKKTGKCYDCK